jgi:hypothetical protein
MDFVKLTFVVASCLAARTAAAQPATQPVAAPTPAPSQSVVPGVLSTANGTTLDGRIDYTSIREDSAPSLIALNLHIQHVTPMGVGGYLSLPIAYARGDSESETALGNLQLGGLYVIRGRNFDAYVRGGLALKQSATDEDFGFLVPLANYVPRLGDAFATGFGTSWARAGAGLRLTSDSLVIGGATGLDYAFDADDSDIDASLSLFHLSGSIGFVQPGFSLAVGATVVRALDESSDDDSLIVIHTMGDIPIGPRARFYGAINFNPEEDVNAVSIGFGVRASM